MGDTAEHAGEAILRLRSIGKDFGTTRALSNMSLDIRRGEIIGLVGPNGAGKTTLMKVITGAHASSRGELVFDGAPLPSHGLTTATAKSLGVACAYQELSLFPNLKVYENFQVSLARRFPLGRPGWRRRAAADARASLDRVFPGHGIDVHQSAGDLPLPQRQMVEIARAVAATGLRILILDEPTSSLTADRIVHLHDAMRTLAGKGVALVYISHKLDEIERICDRVVVMKSGSSVWEGLRTQTSLRELVEILGGKVSVGQRAAQENPDLPVALAVDRLCTRALRDVSLHVRRGEIVGVSGLEGAGQTDVIREIFAAAGAPRRHPAVRLSAGVSYVSGDRLNEGIFPLWDIADNTVISSLDKVAPGGLIRMRRYLELARTWFDKLKFTARGIRDDITSLSGGNQQKALLARCLAADTGIILLNDPTSGVDIETKQEIYRLLDEARRQGKSILLHSTEDLEMEQCDRVYVMHEGRVVEELVGERVSVQSIVTTSFREKSRGAAAGGDVAAAAGSVRPGQTGGIVALLRRTVANRAFLAVATTALIFLVNALYNHRISTYLGVQLLYSSAVPLIFIALGQMFIVIPGGIDLGNGQSVGLLNVLVAFILVSAPGLGVAYLALAVLAYAGLAAVIYLTKIPAIVITLGASFVWLGVALTVAPVPGGHAPAWLSAFYNYHFPIVPLPIVIAAAAGAGAWWIVRRSKYGMIINAMGSNPVAVSRAGWSQLTAVVVAYTLAGLMNVIGAFLLTAIASSGDANSSRAYNMLSIATIVLGGCSFAGGISSPVGVVVAALGISSISFLLTFVGIDSNLQSAVTGLVLIAALALKLVSGRMEARR
jgi:ribose transport system ATP-binding protein